MFAERNLDEVYRRHGGSVSYERRTSDRRNSLKMLLKRKIKEKD